MAWPTLVTRSRRCHAPPRTKAEGAEVVRSQRLAVGEGIEKVVEDYAAEVMKQAGLA